MKAMRNMIVMAAALVSTAVHAQYTDGIVKIGVLSDMSGLYSDGGGSGSVTAAKLAVEDFGVAKKGMKVEIVGGDHLNKPDVGSNIASTWFDVDKVDVIVDGLTSGVSLAVSEIARQKNKLFLAGSATPDLTGSKCSPNTIHWVYDSWATANGTVKATVKTGGDSWFFLTVDHAGGYALESDAIAVIEASGGKVLGKVRHPINNNDFSSFLLQAQASRAKVIGLANGRGRHQCDQAGGGIWNQQGRTARRQSSVVRERCCRARLAGRPRYRPDRGLVLGHERRQPRLDQTMAGGAPRQTPCLDPIRGLFVRYALSQGC